MRKEEELKKTVFLALFFCCLNDTIYLNILKLYRKSNIVFT